MTEIPSRQVVLAVGSVGGMQSHTRGSTNGMSMPNPGFSAAATSKVKQVKKGTAAPFLYQVMDPSWPLERAWPQQPTVMAQAEHGSTNGMQQRKTGSHKAATSMD